PRLTLSPLPTLFPYTTLFRSSFGDNRADRRRERYRRSNRFVLSTETRGGEFQGALPISSGENPVVHGESEPADVSLLRVRRRGEDRKSTRLNSSHRTTSYAVF